MGLTQNNYLFL